MAVHFGLNSNCRARRQGIWAGVRQESQKLWSASPDAGCCTQMSDLVQQEWEPGHDQEAQAVIQARENDRLGVGSGQKTQKWRDSECIWQKEKEKKKQVTCRFNDPKEKVCFSRHSIPCMSKGDPRGTLLVYTKRMAEYLHFQLTTKEQRSREVK